MQREEGKRLREFMDLEGITVEALMEATGKTQSTVAKYLNGRLEMSLAVLKVLHLKFGLRYEYLLHGIRPAKLTSQQQEQLSSVTELQQVLIVAQDSLDKAQRLVSDLNGKKGVKHGVKTPTIRHIPNEKS